MELSQLITLVHVAELGSVSKAADRLNIVQPALSRQIKLLEEELGAPLFERHGRGMALTPAGEEAVEHAVRVIAEIEAMRRSVESGRTSFRGLVRLGVPPTVADLITVPLMMQLREQHPELKVRFSSAFSGHLLDWLQRGELDIVMTYDPPSTKSLRVVPVMAEQLYLIRPIKPLSDAPTGFRDIAGEKLVLPSPRHGLRALLDECARRVGFTLEHVVEADSYSAMIDLVRAGFGSTILPIAPIHRQIEAGELFATPLSDPNPERTLVICYSADRPVSAAVRHAGQLLAGIAGALVEKRVWVGSLLGKSAQPRVGLTEPAPSR